jgi:UDP-N-acetylglucosamine:LPS N-acetylglucosamine transferase
MLPEEIHHRKIFIAALDWGLGHCGRMIPLIEQLLEQQNEIIFGGTPTQKCFFSQESLDITFIDFPGYEFDIPTKNWEWHFLKQLPKLNKVLKKEHALLEEVVEQWNIDLVISDHRYGLYHSSVHSIFTTHQMTLPAATGKQLINNIHHKKIAKFDDVWTIDHSDNSLAGNLSLPIPGINSNYIGSLSRCQLKEAEIKYKAICIVSGPEPHKGIFFELMKELCLQLNIPILMISANPEEDLDFHIKNLHILSHVNSTKLNALINQSEWVISRSGFTTVMDVMQLKKKSVLIPTPGQGEQEYLGKFHAERSENIHCISQDDVNLAMLISILFPA